jgi:hypothetical protein
MYYGVMPACAYGCGSSTTFNNLCSVASHELAEMITDPAVGLASSNAPPLAPTVQSTYNLTISFMTDDYPKETYSDIYDMTDYYELA